MFFAYFQDSADICQQSAKLYELISDFKKAFEFINGFHDCANAIATVVSTKVLSPKQAVLFGASLEFVGALTGTDVTKTIGAGIVNADIITLTVILCALTMAAGTMNGGWKIIKTMGHKIIKLKPIHGFAAETSAAGLILIASHFGIPLSTTHVISTSIMGVGSTFHAHAVKWRVVGNIVIAWVVTIPACMLISSAIYYLLYKFF